jgi:hypothetical protein
MKPTYHGAVVSGGAEYGIAGSSVNVIFPRFIWLC